MKFSRIITLLVSFFIPLTALGQVTVSGHVTLPSGSTPSVTSVIVRFVLKNYGQTTPRVTTTGTFVTPSQDFVPNSSGFFTGPLWGNDVITPSGTYYQVVILYRGQSLVPPQSYIITGSTWTLDTATPVQPAPAPVGNILTARTFEYTQATAATTWTINHNFGDRNVVFSCYGTSPTAGAGTQFLIPDTATETSINTLTITFQTPQSGSCNVMNAGNSVLTVAPANAFILNPNATQTVGSQSTVFTGPVTFQGTVIGGGSSYFSTDGVQFVGPNGNDFNDGLSPKSAKATLAGALAALPVCSPFPNNPNAGNGTTNFTGSCGTIFLASNGQTSSSGYAVSSTLLINGVMARIVGVDELSTVIQCAVSPCIEFFGGISGGKNYTPDPQMSASGGLEKVTVVGNGSSNQVGVLTIDGAGLTFRNLRIENFTGTGSVCMENENDANGESERLAMDDVALDNCTTELLTTTTSSGLISFNHQNYHHLQFTVASGQTAWALSQNAQWTGLVDGVINATATTTSCCTGIAISNSAALTSYYWGLVFDNIVGSNWIYTSGTTPTNFRIFGADYHNSSDFYLQDSQLFFNNSTSAANTAYWCWEVISVPKYCQTIDGSGFLGLFDGLSAPTELFYVARGTTNGQMGFGGTSGFTNIFGTGNANVTIPAATGHMVLSFSTPPTAASNEVSMGASSLFGNGSSGTAVTTTTKGTGTGPTTPQTIVGYMQVSIAGTTYYVPLMQ